jgi:hypothetical protein
VTIHHKLLKLIFQNINFRGCSPLYLSGMQEAGDSEGVTVWRPLLAFNKDAIYNFAHK